MFKKFETHLISPVRDRLISLDVLRGFAVLGMLLINIQSFSMASMELIYPQTSADLTGLNKAIWLFSYIFADQKFLIIFSCLFGASIILFTSRIDKQGGRAVRMHQRRTFWLQFYQFGPVEWLWRSLTYGRIQPLRSENALIRL